MPSSIKAEDRSAVKAEIAPSAERITPSVKSNFVSMEAINPSSARSLKVSAGMTIDESSLNGCAGMMEIVEFFRDFTSSLACTKFNPKDIESGFP